MNRIIVVTHPGQVNDEIEICKELLGAGLEKLHVRKYKWTEAKIKEWLSCFTQAELDKMTIHHQQKIYDEIQLGGLHLPYSNDFSYAKQDGQTFSCSVHTWNEAKIALDYCDYVFISPVFDSISKTAYSHNEALKIIPADLKDKKIFALGGIEDNNIAEVYKMGYYGAVVLGYIWNKPEEAVENFMKLTKKVQHV
jgi:thiamine-phosphate pyrophosphorylase